MKFKNKIMTAIVSICMLAFILPMAVSAADNADSSDKNTITCYVRAEQDDGTILPYTKVTMNKDEVPSFQSYKIKNAPDDADYITPLHILLQALTDKGMTDELATVDIGSSGWITDMFGWGMDQLWCLNGIDAPTVSAQYKAKDGDKYTFYQAAGNWGAGYGYPGYGFFGEYGPGQDYTPYSAIETDDVTTGVGSDVELTYRYTSSMHTPQYGPCNNEDGAYTMIFVGKNGADKVTDEDYREDIEVDKDGKFKVSFDKPGTYVVSGRYYNNDNTRGACNAYCKVTVLDAVEYAQKTIDALDDITLNSEKAIEEAKKAYNLLTDEQKEQIKNADAIKTAEEKLSKLQVENAESKISAIGDVTLDSKDAIKDARDTYDALTDDQKKQVTNYDVLETAEAKLSDLQVENVKTKIDGIGEVTLSSSSTIKAARTAYDALTDDQKKQVTNYDVLEAAEKKLSDLQVENVKNKIDGIGEVTLSSSSTIKAARSAYNALTADQKKQVTNYDVLQKAESELSDLQKADAVVTKIKNIGKVTLKSESKIKQARTAYNKLTDKQKTLVTNYDVLEKAEKDLADLKAADQVSKNITNIGTVTLESEDAIKEARTAYDALTDAQKELVSNKDVLEKAEKDLADLKAADQVSKNITNIGTVTLESEDVIKEARTAYDALTDAQKKLVSNKDVLEKAETTLKELQNAKAADVKAAEEVTNKISAIGDVTLESEDAIKEARTAYDALTDAQKELVSNKDVLEKAETTLKELKDAKDADDAKAAATPKSITLSNTRYIYNGKVQKPQVTVKNAKGEVIKGYTVKYAGNCKNVGKYKVTLTFKGDYNGTKTKTFKIAPKSVTVKSLKAAKKRFDVKWSKQTTQVTGYQVQYSTDKNFVKAVKNKKITKNSVVTKTVKNLKSKKVYYVRVRTYTTVKYNGEQMNLHSDWSKVKKVTVK
ncbi:MAG: fibronectin type III domain-containing protein [Dorea sp.]